MPDSPAPVQLKNILITGLVAGTLDATAAVVLLAKMKAAATFKYIASGVFGQDAFAGGANMVAWGVFFHYFIAMSFTAAYMLAYPRVPFLRRHKMLSGILYGLLVWVVMNKLVVPLSGTPKAPFNWANAFKNMAILIACIGLPVALLADYFGKRRRD